MSVWFQVAALGLAPRLARLPHLFHDASAGWMIECWHAVLVCLHTPLAGWVVDAFGTKIQTTLRREAFKTIPCSLLVLPLESTSTEDWVHGRAMRFLWTSVLRGSQVKYSSISCKQSLLLSST
jgi:hypothetical protein